MKGYRTIAVMALTFVIGGVQSVSPLVGQETAGYLIAGVGILGIILRLVTTGPVGSQPKDE